jgi:hypothetical protein
MIQPGEIVDSTRKSGMTRQEHFIAKAATMANMLLVAGGVVSLLVLCYFLYQYSWSGNREFASRTGVLMYYVIPVLAAGLLFAALRLKPAYKINIVLVGFGVIASVYAAELYLRMAYSSSGDSGTGMMGIIQKSKEQKKLVAELSQKYGVEIDTRSRLEVIADLKHRGIDAVPSVIPRFQLQYKNQEEAQRAGDEGKDQVLPLGGISNKVTIVCNENGQHLIYESDEHGFNNPKGLWNSGRVDIVAVGDSFAQGYCVPSDKNFVALIRQRYPSTLNLGMAGEGPLLMLATLKEYAQWAKPRLVLWFYFEGNDLLDLQDERQSSLLMRYLEDGFSQNLLERQEVSDKALVSFIEKAAAANAKESKRREAKAAKKSRVRTILEKAVDFIKLSSLRPRLGLAFGSVKQDPGALAEVESNMSLHREILLQARALVSSWGGKLCFVYLPNWTRYQGSLRGDSAIDLDRWEFGNSATDRLRAQVMQTASDLGIPVIDMVPAFDAIKDPMSLFPFGTPGHYNEAGHRLVAEEVLKALVSGKLDLPAL